MSKICPRFRRRLILSICWFLVFLLCLAIGVSANAQPAITCDTRDRIVKGLAEDFGGTLRARGLNEQGLMVEVYASSETGTWAIVETEPNMWSCVSDTGTGFYVWLFPDAEGEPL